MYGQLSRYKISTGFGYNAIQLRDIIDYVNIYGSIFTIDLTVQLIHNIDYEIDAYKLDKQSTEN